MFDFFYEEQYTWPGKNVFDLFIALVIKPESKTGDLERFYQIKHKIHQHSRLA